MDNVGVLIVAVASAFGITAFVMRGMATRFFADYDSLRGRIETLEAEAKAERKAKEDAQAAEKLALEGKQEAEAKVDTLQLEKSQLVTRLDAQDQAQVERDQKATEERAALKQAFEDFKTQSASDLTAEVEKRVTAEAGEKRANEQLTAALAENTTLKEEMAALREGMQGQINALNDKIATLENKTGEMPDRPSTGNLAGKPDTGSDAG